MRGLHEVLRRPVTVGGVAAASLYGTVASLPPRAVETWGLSPATAALLVTAARILSVPAKLVSETPRRRRSGQDRPSPLARAGAARRVLGAPSGNRARRPRGSALRRARERARTRRQRPRARELRATPRLARRVSFGVDRTRSDHGRASRRRRRACRARGGPRRGGRSESLPSSSSAPRPSVELRRRETRRRGPAEPAGGSPRRRRCRSEAWRRGRGRPVRDPRSRSRWPSSACR